MARPSGDLQHIDRDFSAALGLCRPARGRRLPRQCDSGIVICAGSDRRPIRSSVTELRLTLALLRTSAMVTTDITQEAGFLRPRSPGPPPRLEV